MTDQQWPWLENPTELARMLAEHHNNAEALSRTTGCPVGRIKRRRQAIGITMPPGPTPGNTPPIDPVLKERYTAELMREVWVRGDCAITSDWHIPLTDWALVELLIGYAKKLGIKKLVIAGDFFNMDALSDYLPKQQDAGLIPELAMATECMKYLLEWFDEIWITLGNHDERILKVLGFKLRFEHAIKMLFYELSPEQLAKIHVTGRDYVKVETPEGPWHVCHTKSYSRIPLSVLARLADKLRCHVAGGHRHHHALGWSPSGYRVLELGGLFDASRTHYLTRYTTDFPNWQPGFSFLLDGVPYCPMLTATPEGL